jgi:hypothetical protein
MSFEDELRAALQRAPAPPDFAAKVLAKTTLAKTTRAESARQARVLPFWRRPVTLALAAVLAIAALVPSAVYQYRERQRAIEARDQLVVALSITRVQLAQVKERIRQNTRHKI